MTTNKIDLNSIIAGMRPEKRKEFLEALKPNDAFNESQRILLETSRPIMNHSIFQKLLKECTTNFENTGSITANALARQKYNRQRPLIHLRQFPLS